MNITIQQSDQVTERNVPASIIHCLYNLGEDPNINLSGAIQLTGGSYMEELEAVQSWYQNLYITPDKTYIRFADPIVEQIVANHLTQGGGNGVTLEDCARLTTLPQPWFRLNSQITSFNELKYFTNLTKINGGAFYGCTNLESIGIPNSLITCEVNVFGYCSKLKKVYITDLPAWFRITWDGTGSNPFSQAKGDLYLNDSKLTNLVIPDEITTIKTYAMYGCTGITTVEFHSDINLVLSDAFKECTNLTAVYISDLAAWCGITFRDSLSNPLAYAGHLYLNGTELTGDLVIPDGVQSVGQYVFYGMSGITSVTIPNSVTSFGVGNFATRSSTAASNLKIYISNLENWFNFYPKSLLGGSPKLYLNGDLVTSVTVPDGITELHDGIFYNLSDITTITLPNSLTNIGQEAFEYCTGLTSINIPSSVTKISQEAFKDCTGLTSINIPSSVTSIEGGAFNNCTGLTRVDISDLESWMNISFLQNSTSNPLQYAHHLYLNGTEISNLVIPNTVSRIKQYAFYECRGLASVTIPSTVTMIDSNTFQYCTGLTSVIISEGVNYIGSNAFSSCSSLTSVTIPSTVTRVENYSFQYCTGLTSVIISEGVKTIGYYAFYSCSSLTSVTIPSTVTSIGMHAFGQNNNLMSVTCNAIVPPTIDLQTPFPSGVQHYYVPEGSVDTYKAAPYWNAYADRIQAIPSNP